MCDSCGRNGDKTMDLLLDYMLLGLHLEVSVQVVRDSLVQGVLNQQLDAEESMHNIRYLTDVVNEQAGILRSMSDDDFRESLTTRAVLAVLS